MIPAYFAIATLIRKVRQGWKDTEFRGLFWMVLTFLFMGTIFYHNVEKWSWIDSFYFTVITLSTVGYGDFSPQTNLGKLFTVIYIIMGLGMLSSFIIKLATIRVRDNNGKRMTWLPASFAQGKNESNEETEE